MLSAWPLGGPVRPSSQLLQTVGQIVMLCVETNNGVPREAEFTSVGVRTGSALSFRSAMTTAEARVKQWSGLGDVDVGSVS